ncbi:MAG TPA: hypothetical protein VIF82_00115 [Burkholderiaceae bacterium]
MDRSINLVKINAQEIVSRTKVTTPQIDAKIEEKYQDNVFILRAGSIEEYAEISHANLNALITFCRDRLKDWLHENGVNAKEINEIIQKIVV